MGILAYELIVGRVPFDGTDEPLAIVLRHLNEPIASAHAVDPAIDRGLSDWIARLLVKDPAARTQTAERAWDELEEVVLRLLGSRWRREARLVSASELPEARPLTVATFGSTGVETPTRDSDPSPSAGAWRGAVLQAGAVTPRVEAEDARCEPSPAPTPRSAEPARPAEARFKRRRAALLASGATVLVVAGAGIVVLAGAGGDGGSGDGSATRPVGAHVLRTANLELTLPASWTKRQVPGIPGLDPGDAVAAAPGRGSYVAAGLIAGRADPSLLAPKLLAALEQRPKPEATTLAGTAAYRYDRLAPRGRQERLRVYAVLTDAGVATVVCGTGAGAAGTAAAECDAIARTLKLRSAKALPIEPSEGYAATLAKTFATLDARVTVANGRLDEAHTVTAQAAALGRLADAYAAAAAAMTRTDAALNPVDTGLNAKLRSAGLELAAAYHGFERLVKRSDAAADARAEHAVRRARVTVAAAVGSLRSAGYSAAPRATPRAHVTLLAATRPPVIVPPAAVTPPAAPLPPAAAPPAPPPIPSGGGGDLGGGGGA